MGEVVRWGAVGTPGARQINGLPAGATKYYSQGGGRRVAEQLWPTAL